MNAIKKSKVILFMAVFGLSAGSAIAAFKSGGIGQGSAVPSTLSDIESYVNSDLDSDLDGYNDPDDAFPNDPNEWVDTDGDGVGDNGDAFPNDASETADSDSDGVGDNADAFPNDATETVDSDGDGTGDNSDPYPNNYLPVVSSTPADVSVAKGVAITSIDMSSHFSDANSDTLAYTMTGNPAGLTLVGSTLSGSSTAVGTYTITVTASDDENGVSTTFDVTISNTTPTVVSAPSDESVAKGISMTSIDFNSVFEDADNDTLTFSVSGNPSGVSLSGGTLSGSTSTTGTYSIILTATDTDNASVTDTFVLTVTNTTPTVTASPSDETIVRGEAITTIDLSSVFNDADSDTMTYSVSGNPTGTSLSGSSFSGTIPDNASAATSTITFTASDGVASVSTSYDLTTALIWTWKCIQGDYRASTAKSYCESGGGSLAFINDIRDNTVEGKVVNGNIHTCSASESVRTMANQNPLCCDYKFTSITGDTSPWTSSQGDQLFDDIFIVCKPQDCNSRISFSLGKFPAPVMSVIEQRYMY